MEQKERRKRYIEAYKEEYNKRNKQVNLIFTNSEYERFKKLADKENKKVSTLIKELSTKHLNKTVMIPKEIIDKVNEFVFLVRNIGNNINQIAHQSNILKTVISENKVLSHLQLLEEAVKNFISKSLKD